MRKILIIIAASSQFVTCSIQAAVTLTADPGYPAGAQVFTVDPEAHSPGQRRVSGTRHLRQTFQLSESIDVSNIVLSLAASGTNGGLVISFYQVADVNAANWTAGTLVKTITLDTSVSLPASTARLGLSLSGADVFTLPQRNTGTAGYGIEIANYDGVSTVGNLRHSNDGVDDYPAGKFYIEDGTASGTGNRDIGLALTGTVTNITSTNFPGTTEVLESPVLRLEVDTSPFSFRLIEKSTGTNLLSQSANQFTFGNASYIVSSATNVVIGATNLDADLVLSGSPTAAHVTFSFVDSNIVQVTLTSTNATQILQQFSDQGENIYGIWGYPFNGSINSRGTDQNFLGFQGATGINYSSVRAPFYLTSHNYGIYAQTEAQGHFKAAVGGNTSFSFNTSQLTYDMIYGQTPAEILTRYNSLAGGSFMPPTWAFSTIWWKNDDHFDFHAGVTNAQSNVLDTADKLQSYHIPASAMWIDRPYGTGSNGWGNLDFDSSFPNPAQMVSDLNARGMNLMLWIANRCFINTYLTTNAQAHGYLVSNISMTVGPAVDARNTNAYIWLETNLNAFVNLGIKGYKIDRGDEGEMPDALQNQIVTLFQKLTSEGQAAVHPNDYFSFARDVCDTGRKSVAVWNGDPAVSFQGLQYTVMSGLRAGLMDFPMWGADTGGYSSTVVPSEELFARWFEFSAYSPMMEILIGYTRNGGRTPWYNYSSNLVAIAQAQCAAHHDLIPYTRSLAYGATQDGIPVMRPMFLEFPDDSSLSNTWDQYMFGPGILVAPVVSSGATSRSVYLPAGLWMDYNSQSAVFSGPTNLTVPAPLDTIPLFVKAGAIIPRGDILKANNNWTPGWMPQLRIEFFPQDTTNSTFNYYTGSGVQTITCSNLNHTLTIQFGDLGNNGNLELHLSHAGTVVRNGLSLSAGTDYTYDATNNLLRVPFNGVTTLVVSNAFGLFSPVDVWRTAYFTNLSDPAISGDGADPDHDGIPNLLEYAFGLDPTNALRTGLPYGEILTQNGTNYFALVYQRIKEPSGLVFTVETSPDLKNWTSGPTVTQTENITDMGTLQQVTERLLTPIANSMASFVRLTVRRQ